MDKKNGIKWMVDKYINGLNNGKYAKILWGNRSINKIDWVHIKKFIQEYNIKTVLEYGVGLSTELMVLEGVKVVSLETLEWWTNICRKIINKEVIHYDSNKIPVFAKKFDMAFIDGPKGGRVKEILHAKTISDIIYLHDPSRKNELELMNDWVEIEILNYSHHFFSRK